MKIIGSDIHVTVKCEKCGKEHTQVVSGMVTVDEAEHQAANSACPDCDHQEVVERTG